MDGERRTFADNQDGNTVAEALIRFARYSEDRWPIAIASGYFDLSGFAVLAGVLEAAPAVRILLGTEPHPPRVRRSHDGLSSREEPVTDAVADLQSALVVERDLLPFDAATARNVERLRELLRKPTTEVRLYRERFLHGKAFVFGHEAAVVAGSANFTAGGLVHNLELDLGQYEPERVQQVRGWFDRLWERAEPYDLAAVFAARLSAFEPYPVYLRMLYELYGDEPELRDAVAQPAPGQTALRLAAFQRLGVLRAQRILDRHGGVLIADGVGLGKTFVAGGLLQHAVREDGMRALLVTPASLRDSTWERFRTRYQLYLENVSYQQLAADTQLEIVEPAARRSHLAGRAEEYRFIVVDEAHAFRNPDTFHYRALRRLMAAGGTPKKLVLLTATPVNNSLDDLYHQIMLFARHEAAFADLGILSLRALFERARKTELDSLTPHLLFPLLDAISVRRTRRHIQRYYADELIGDPPRPIAFPRPHLRSCRYSLSADVPGLFDDVAAAIEGLTLAVYRPDAYRAGAQAGRQEVIAALLRSQLLKRFESSLGAFATTVERLVAAHDRFLATLDRGVVLSRDMDPAELGDELGDEPLVAVSDGDLVEVPLALYDAATLRADAERDRNVLRELGSRARAIVPAADPKLRALLSLLGQLGRAARPDDRKVVLFTYYADTVAYIRSYLEGLPAGELGPYAGRYASVTGAASPEERQRIVWSFVPRSAEAPPGEDADRIDLILATDALAEGQNLQQAGRLINFDLPWNPMRLVQRNGRIDRLWSDHSDIYLYSFFPEAELDALLRLEERLRDKLRQANAAIGVETAPLPGTRAAEHVFADAEERIRAILEEDEQVLEAEEREIDAFSGEVFREDLRRALLEGREAEIRSMPWGAGSGHRYAGATGVLFAARIGSERIWRFVPLDANGLRDDLLGLLDLARCAPDAPRHLPPHLEALLYVLWARARDDMYATYMAQLDPLARQAAVPRAQRDAVTLLQGVVVEGAADAIAALQVPWPLQVSRSLRRLLHELRRPDADPEAVAREIVGFVTAEGLRVPASSSVPDPIEPQDVHLVAFQVVSS